MKKIKKINSCNKKKQAKEITSSTNATNSVEQALENYRKLRDKNRRIQLLKEAKEIYYD